MAKPFIFAYCICILRCTTGGWNVDGKGPNIWDEFTHSHPEKIADHQNADIGPNSYEFYRDDIEILRNLSVIKLQNIFSYFVQFKQIFFSLAPP